MKPAFAQAGDFSDIPDEYLEEALNFHDYCEKSTNMNNYYDCRCLSARFLDKRMEVGPDIPESGVFQAISKTCKDATEAAGSEYSRCMGNRTIMPPEIPAEMFCECYANTYAKLYEEIADRPSSKRFVAIQTQAMVSCRNPELAKRLYPYQAK